jgi:long-chain fatty acid transport protein
MTLRLFFKGVLALAFCSALPASVLAGGFSRGDADTDILFEDGNVVVRTGIIGVYPQRDFKTINGAPATDGVFSDDYFIPNVAAKFRISENLACAATYTQPFGGSSTYGPQAQAADGLADSVIVGGVVVVPGNFEKHKEFTTHEYGATCDVSFSTGPGDLHLIGGGFLQSFSYTQDTFYGRLDLEDDGAPGYRVGVAYDIPEYAMRAQLMYRSEVHQKADGDFSPDFLAAFPGFGPAAAHASGELPQSLELSLQSGVAPGWLVYGSAKWTDWSVLQTLDYTIENALADQHIDFFWKDGWTIQAGVAHAFTDKVAGTINLTWDRGVGTGADIMTDMWTIGAGTSIKTELGELRFGVGVTYMEGGSQSVAKGANFNATAGEDWALAFSGSYKISF